MVGGGEAIGAGATGAAAAGGAAEVVVVVSGVGVAVVVVVSGVGAAVVVAGFGDVVGAEVVLATVDVVAATRPGALGGDAQPPSKSVTAPARTMPVPSRALKRFLMFPY